MVAARALLALLALGVPATGQVEALREVPLEWSDLAPVPNVVGLGGPFVGVYAGVDGDVLIVAGGANFPGAPPWGAEPGEKIWHDEVYVLESPDGEWIEAGKLEHPLAYGAVVPLPIGLALIGGSDAGGAHADVRLLRWSKDGLGEPVDMPSLPAPTSFCAAARVGEWLLVVPDGRANLWGYPLTSATEPFEWIELPPFPGEPRAKALAVVQADGFGVERFYLFSGEVTETDADGNTSYRYLDDAWSYEPEAQSWTRLADLPRPAAAGSVVPFGQTHVLVLGGVAGREMHLPLEERTGFPNDILAYHTITDTWVVAGEMPQGVVTTSAVVWNGEIVVPSGEVRPGVRTARVQRAVPTGFEGSFGTLDTTVLVLYLAALVGMGYLFSRREQGTADYFLAGKRVPWWAAGLSIFGTALSAITFLSVPSVSYATDWLIVWAWIPILLMAPVVIWLFLPVYRRLNLTSAYEYLEHRFSLAVRLFGSSAFIVFQVGRMAIVVYLPALALSTFAGIDVYVCILVVGGLSTLYTVLGGIEAVVWTDVLQVVVLMGGVLFALFIAIGDVGGVSQVVSVANEASKLRAVEGGWSLVELATWSIVFGSLFQNFAPYASDQTTIQRYMSTPDEKSAARGIWLNGLLSIPAALLFFALGTCFYVWFKTHPEALAIGMKNDEIFPLFISTRLPSGVSGLVVAGVFAASMSSLDSSMHAIATVFTTDFYRRFRPMQSDRRYLFVARVTTVAMGGLGTGAAVWLAASDVASVFFFFQKLLGVASSGLAGVFILGVCTKRTTAKGALAGAASSTAAVAWVTWWTDMNLYLYAAVGVLTCVVVGYSVSLLGRRRAEPA